jgi:hypothetical protein
MSLILAPLNGSQLSVDRPAALPTSISTCGVVATNFGIERFWTDMDFRKVEKHAVVDQADWHGHRHVEGAVAQPYPSIVDNSVEKVDFRLAQRARHKRVRRLAPNLFRYPDLHQRAFAQDRDPIAESQRLLIVVGDVHRGGVRHGAKLFELGPYRGAQLGVQVGQWFVEQIDVRRSASTRPSATRWRCPLDSSRGKRLSRWFMSYRRTAAAGLTEDVIPVGATVTASGHRHLDEATLEIKTERLTWNGTVFNVYPERN